MYSASGVDRLIVKNVSISSASFRTRLFSEYTSTSSH